LKKSIGSKTKLLGLFGKPARHSLSPMIQNTFLSSYDIDCVYMVFEPEENNLKEAFSGAANLEFIGLNITMPYKEKIYALTGKTWGSAEIIKAVNTIKFSKGTEEKIVSEGFSTDGSGFIKSLEDFGFVWKDRTCLIIGAGGAAKSTVFELEKKGLRSIYIFDIDSVKSQNLRNTIINYSGCGTQIDVLADIKEAERFYDSIDLIINCTPAGMNLERNTGNIKKLPVPEYWDLKDKYIFDMVYNPYHTEFLLKARREKAAGAISGIYMLVNQAAFSFKIWFDIFPEEKIIKKIKEKIIKQKLNAN
jgi:shikimate dehydrogenase